MYKTTKPPIHEFLPTIFENLPGDNQFTDSVCLDRLYATKRTLA